MDSGIDFSLYVDGLERCDKQTALSIFQDRSIIKDLGFEAIDIQDINCFYLYAKETLVFLKPKDEDKIEIHICCPRKSRAGVRDIFEKGVQSLKKIDGCRQVFTTAPDGRSALINMLKRLGFQKIDNRWVM